MMPATPIDEGARLLAAESLDECICVEAGAGTGKTTLMVRRITNLVRKGIPIQGIVAITFTEKAASELRQRLRENLELSGHEAMEAGDTGMAELLFGANRDMGQSMIGTIHSFASSILREFPAQAGVDPGFALLDEISANKLMEEAWETWLQDTVNSGGSVLSDFLAIGGRIRDLKAMAFSFRGATGLGAPGSGATVPSVNTNGHWLALLEARDRVEALMGQCRKQEDQALASCRALSAMLKGMSGVPTLDQWISLYANFPACGPRTGNKGNWTGSALQEAREALADGKEACGAVVRAMGNGILTATASLAQGFALSYEGLKARTGVLDFDDLLLKARNLVKRDKGARAALQGRYSCFLVDEFQDTDALQAEMVLLLCASDPDGDDWESVPLKPGKLFIVGDPKQSIYRFRGADIEIYERAKSIVARQGRVLNIVQNFRTVAPVIDWVNKCFSEAIRRPEDGNYQPEYIPLEPFKGKEPGGARVAVLGGPGTVPSDKAKPTMEELRREEARLIAEAIHCLVHGGDGALPADPSMGKVGYGDIALLLPNRNSLDTYEDALVGLGIPYSMDGGKGYYARQEVDYLISFLRAIANPRDEATVLAVLRSPHFCIPDSTLLAHKVRGGRLDYLNPGIQAEAMDEHLAAAFATLSSLNAARAGIGLAALVEHALDATCTIQFLMCRRRGRQAAYNLMKVCDLARGFEASGGATLSSFADWLEDQRRTEAAEAESPETEASDDVVRIMTIHKSKGLEFPVVILGNLAGKGRAATGPVPYGPGGTLEFRKSIPGTKDEYFTTPHYDTAKELDGVREAAERVRLLYVAATRPKELLIIPALTEDEGTLLGHLLGHLSLPSGQAMDKPAGTATTPGHSWVAGDTDPETVKGLLRLKAEWRSRLDGLISRASAPRPLSRPSLHDPTAPGEGPTAPVAASPDDSGGALIGTAFHKGMELAWPKGGISPDPLAAAREACALNGCPEHTAEVHRLIVGCLATPGLGDLLSCSRVYHEVPFSMPDPRTPGTLCEGVIDLLCEYPDGTLAVVDFKSDRVSREGVDGRFAEYAVQGMLYGAAVEAVSPGALRGVWFVFARPREMRMIPASAISGTIAGTGAWHLETIGGTGAVDKMPTA